jgi:glycosyltransferase involved in cell wall biosynthesis
MGAIAKRSVQAKLLFDIRGFFPEEYVDAGVWPKGGYLYRGAKAVERRLFKAADAFVVLTESARTILFEKAQEMDRQGRPVEVIPCCVDLRRFEKGAGPSRKDIRRKLNLTDRRVIVYVGALGGWYLTKEMAELLAVGHRQDEKTFSLILTQSPPEMLEEHLRRHGVSKESYLIRKVAPVDVPCYLRASDIALSFIKPCYSKLSSSPTKIAEYLASGLPVICNSGIGDVDEVIEEDRVGVLVNEFNAERYLTALQEITVLSEDRGLAGRCRASAVKRFDLLSVGGARYRRLYRRLYEGNAKQEEERDGELKN